MNRSHHFVSSDDVFVLDVEPQARIFGIDAPENRWQSTTDHDAVDEADEAVASHECFCQLCTLD